MYGDADPTEPVEEAPPASLAKRGDLGEGCCDPECCEGRNEEEPEWDERAGEEGKGEALAIRRCSTEFESLRSLSLSERPL